MFKSVMTKADELRKKGYTVVSFSISKDGKVTQGLAVAGQVPDIESYGSGYRKATASEKKEILKHFPEEFCSEEVVTVYCRM